MEKATVRVTANFENNLADLEAFMEAADAQPAFDDLLQELLDTVILNLERFPGIGRRFLNRPGGSVESASAVQKLGSALNGGELREYLHKDFLILYLCKSEVVSLLAIKHHRQLSFNFDQLWSRAGG